MRRRLQEAGVLTTSALFGIAIALVWTLTFSGCATAQVDTSEDQGIISKFFNPDYAEDWSWWQKAVFWIGPGH